MLHRFKNPSCRLLPSIVICAVYEWLVCLFEAAASLLLQRCEDSVVIYRLLNTCFGRT